jgi:hypothetical protein
VAVKRSGRQERLAENEMTFRRVNEAREPAEGADDPGDVAYVCECGHLGCTDMIELHREQYEAVRTDFDRFLLVPGHEEADVDEVVEHHGHYVVAVKVGAAREALVDEDGAGGGELAGR